MEKVRFGILGCGNVSSTYFYTLSGNRRAELVCAVDIDIQKAISQAKEFGINNISNSFDSMLNYDLNAVAILTPHYEHPSQTAFCANRGIHVLCEKPMATNLGDLESMINVCEKNSVILSTMLQRRFYPNTISAKEVVSRRLLGKITNVKFDFNCYKTKEFYIGWRASKKTGGGVLMSQALHRIDQLVYIFGKPLAVEGETKITRDYLEIEDYASGRIFFGNDVTAEIEANNSFGGAENRVTNSVISISGEKGRIVLADDLTPVWDVSEFQKPEKGNIGVIPDKYRPVYYGPCHEIIINDFVDAILEGRAPVIQGRDSLDCMKVIFGLYESSKKNGEKVSL